MMVATMECLYNGNYSFLGVRHQVSNIESNLVCKILWVRASRSPSQKSFKGHNLHLKDMISTNAKMKLSVSINDFKFDVYSNNF